MATGRVFTANVVLARTPGAEATQFKIGQDVPEWAIEKVGDHASQGVTRAADAPAAPVVGIDSGVETQVVADDADDEDLDSYATWTKAELKDEAKGREIEGFSKMSKDELVAALDADDAADADTEE